MYDCATPRNNAWLGLAVQNFWRMLEVIHSVSLTFPLDLKGFKVGECRFRFRGKRGDRDHLDINRCECEIVAQLAQMAPFRSDLKSYWSHLRFIEGGF